MAEELEKTCENCEYENEDIEGSHCRHCIHNAEEHFAPKINHEKEIREKVIDEFVNALINYQSQDEEYKSFSDVCYEVAEKLKGEEENEIN